MDFRKHSYLTDTMKINFFLDKNNIYKKNFWISIKFFETGFIFNVTLYVTNIA